MRYLLHRGKMRFTLWYLRKKVDRKIRKNPLTTDQRIAQLNSTLASRAWRQAALERPDEFWLD